MEEKQRILIVDDEHLNVAILEELLGDEGYETCPTYDGETALEKFKEFKPDLVLLDVMMPGIDGYETCRRIRSLEDVSDIPIIFLSAKAYIEDKLKGYDAGGDDYITKPFTNEELMAKVTVQLHKKRQMDQLKMSSDQANSLAYSLMSTSAKIGFITRFIRESSKCTDIKSLSDLFFRTARDGFEMHGLLKLITDDGVYFYSDDGDIRTLDKEILECCDPDERIKKFGEDRALFHWGNVMLLVRNLRDDVDTISHLLDGFVGSMNSIISRDKILALMGDLQTHNETLKIEAIDLLNNLSDNLRNIFSEVGSASNLTEEEEETLISVVENTSEHFDRLMADGNNIKNQLVKELHSANINTA